MSIRNQGTVRISDCNVSTEEFPTIHTAKLVYVQGNGSLTTHSHPSNDSYFDITYLEHITLNGTPLIQINSPGCPTCCSLLATGYGIENADCPELKEIEAGINELFVSLDDSIASIIPLLSLMKSGLYLIADAECYPTDGNGNFFWDTPNGPTENPATAGVLLADADFAYVTGHPIYLYPTQDTDCYNSERVNYYMELFQKTNHAPRALSIFVILKVLHFCYVINENLCIYSFQHIYIFIAVNQILTAAKAHILPKSIARFIM